MDENFIVIVRPAEQSFKFGEAVPQGRTKLNRREAIKLASQIRKSDDRDIAVQIVDVKTGKALNVNRVDGNPNMISITHSATNGC